MRKQRITSTRRAHAQRGATLMEALVAILIISVVSATALVIIRYANDSLQREMNRRAMQDVIDDTVEIFAFSDTPERFRQLMLLTGYPFHEIHHWVDEAQSTEETETAGESETTEGASVPSSLPAPVRSETVSFTLSTDQYSVDITTIFYTNGTSEIVISASLSGKVSESFTVTYNRSN